MSAALKPMTLDAFLDWESRQPTKFEFDGFGPVAMTGVSGEHARIQVNLLGQLFNRLRGHRCTPYGSDLKILAAGRIRYPDAFILCRDLTRGEYIVEDPTVVFEILSPSTSHTDRIEKNREYRDTPSIQRYVILEQDSATATVFARDGGDWVGRLRGGDDSIDMPEIGISLSIAELYEGVAFPNAQD